MSRAAGPQRWGPVTPHLWGGEEALSEVGIPEDDLKNEQGLVRKGRGAGCQAEGGAHAWRWQMAVLGTLRRMACETGRETRATTGQKLGSRLRGALTMSTWFCR